MTVAIYKAPKFKSTKVSYKSEKKSIKNKGNRNIYKKLFKHVKINYLDTNYCSFQKEMFLTYIKLIIHVCHVTAILTPTFDQQLINSWNSSHSGTLTKQYHMNKYLLL